jgi:hypothetical protein
VRAPDGSSRGAGSAVGGKVEYPEFAGFPDTYTTERKIDEFDHKDVYE